MTTEFFRTLADDCEKHPTHGYFAKHFRSAADEIDRWRRMYSEACADTILQRQDAERLTALLVVIGSEIEAQSLSVDPLSQSGSETYGRLLEEITFARNRIDNEIEDSNEHR